MASNLNKVLMVGRLTADPDLRYSQNGNAVVNFSIANNRQYKKNGEKVVTASFFKCIAWNKLAEIISEHCKKGHRIAITGRLQQRTWKDPNGENHSAVEISVEEIEFLNEKKE